MIGIRRTAIFRASLRVLRDERAKAWIASRIDRLALGNFGDVKPVGEGVSELLIFYGPGYRVYLVRRGDVLVILLCGGDKAMQGRDVEIAKALARDLEGEQRWKLTCLTLPSSWQAEAQIKYVNAALLADDEAALLEALAAFQANFPTPVGWLSGQQRHMRNETPA